MQRSIDDDRLETRLDQGRQHRTDPDWETPAPHADESVAGLCPTFLRTFYKHFHLVHVQPSVDQLLPCEKF